jgi:hypothetical protein
MVMRSTDYCFGCYLSHPVIPNDQWSGSPSCFLFNLTLDLKLNYHARNLPQVLSNALTAGFIANDKLLVVGNNDLVIHEDLWSGVKLITCKGSAVTSRYVCSQTYRDYPGFVAL